MKVQWGGERRTLRLPTEDLEAAAKEAATTYAEIRRGGWVVVDQRQSRLRVGVGATPARPGVGVRKYVSDFHAGFARELFAEITHRGVREQVALGTEEESVAVSRAVAIQGEVGRLGWKWIRNTYAREVTVAVFWQTNPMTCTYTTLLSMPRIPNGGLRKETGRTKGWRVWIVEPDVPVRRAMVEAWMAVDGVAGVHGSASLQDSPASGAWHIAVANRSLGPAVLRQLERQGSEREAGRAWVLEHGLYGDSDAIFASVSGVSRGYFLKRMPPGALLEPLTRAFPDGPVRARADMERQVRRYFQATFELEDAVAEAPGPSFTGREVQVLDLLGRGLSDKEIGNELGISVWTVHSHLKRIFGKYGVRTRTEAVVRHLQK